jgi:sodium-dependent dicarboxylate transporter 2/3/5
LLHFAPADRSDGVNISLLRTNALIKFSPLIFLILELGLGVFSGGGAERHNSALVLIMLFWMVSWWIFEIMPLGITSLIPLVFLPFFKITVIEKVTPHYSHSVIYLFLGGFILARALEKTRLSERIALEILRYTGTSDRGILIGFTVSTAFLSMWISNTACAMMMLPIAISVVSFLDENLDEALRPHTHGLAVALFLTIAHASNIGGIMTPVGTPPNVVFVGYLDQIYSLRIDFWKWMLAIFPVAALILFADYFVLRWASPFSIQLPVGFKGFIRQKLSKLGPLDGPQRVTLLVFSLVCFLWIFKDLLHYLIGIEFINDTSTAVLGAILLFIIPSQQEESRWISVLNVKDIARLPWNIVLLFGGGMAMAAALQEVGLIKMATEYFASLNITSPWLLVALLSLMTLILTEIMSNVALAVIALPVIMNLGVAMGLNPILVGLPAALTSSFGFMMPVGTPPNAIVFGTGKVKMSEMMKAGFMLNIISFVVMMTLGCYLFALILGS